MLAECWRSSTVNLVCGIVGRTTIEGSGSFGSNSSANRTEGGIMKTLGLRRTIRRKLPDGWLVWIGPESVRFRQKRRKETFVIGWKEIRDRAMLNSLRRYFA